MEANDRPKESFFNESPQTHQNNEQMQPRQKHPQRRQRPPGPEQRARPQPQAQHPYLIADRPTRPLHSDPSFGPSKRGNMSTRSGGRRQQEQLPQQKQKNFKRYQAKLSFEDLVCIGSAKYACEGQIVCQIDSSLHQIPMFSAYVYFVQGEAPINLPDQISSEETDAMDPDNMEPENENDIERQILTQPNTGIACTDDPVGDGKAGKKRKLNVADMGNSGQIRKKTAASRSVICTPSGRVSDVLGSHGNNAFYFAVSPPWSSAGGGKDKDGGSSQRGGGGGRGRGRGRGGKSGRGGRGGGGARGGKNGDVVESELENDMLAEWTMALHRTALFSSAASLMGKDVIAQHMNPQCVSNAEPVLVYVNRESLMPLSKFT